MKKQPRVDSASERFRHLEPDKEPSWFSHLDTEEELEERCKRDYEESYSLWQKGIADGVYTERDLKEVGNVQAKRLFRARTIMSITTRNGVEDRWAKKVIAEHVGSLIDNRLSAVGASKHERDVLRKRWCMAIVECGCMADPEQVIWATLAVANEKWF